MKRTFAFIQFIRWLNLLIISFTQWVIWRLVVFPILLSLGKEIFLTNTHFFLLCLSTILIAAAGFIINDYFDISIDLINKPRKVFVNNEFSKKATLTLYFFFNIIGLFIALFLSWKANKPFLILIQFACIFLLYYYSKRWKKEFVIGNLVIAGLAALTTILIPLYESTLYSYLNQGLTLVRANGEKVLNPFIVLLFYTFFAFMLTWIREIVKDMEDVDGDAKNDCSTMPIKIGLAKTQKFILIIGILTLLPLVLAVVVLLIDKWWMLASYIIVFLISPLLYFLFFLFSKSTLNRFKMASMILKIIMVAGIFSLVAYGGILKSS